MCTLMTIESKDKAVITGRTNEFEGNYLSQLIFRPRNTKSNSTFTFKDLDHTWTNKYSYLFINAPGLLNEKYLASDAMNEHGLSASMLYFHYHQYRELDKSEVKEDNINIIFLLAWVIGNMKTVQEIRDNKAELERIFYWAKGVSQQKLGQHISFIDRSGDSVVIEPENGEIRIKENPLRVLTNSSPLEYHYENVRVYSHLTADITEPRINFRNMPGHKLLSGGNGLYGLPGDFTANSRFIRAALFTSLAEVQDTAEESSQLLMRMLHTSDIIPGYVNEHLPKEELDAYIRLFPAAKLHKHLENTLTSHTDSIIVKDLENTKWFYKTSRNINPRLVDLKKIAASDKEIIIEIDNDGTDWYTEMLV